MGLGRANLPACVLCIFCLLAIGASAHAEITISTLCDWTLSIGDGDLQGGAGSNLRSTYDSSGSPGSVTVAGTSDNSDSWRVDVHRLDTTWNGSMTLSIERIGDGAGGGSISGGDSYAPIAGTDSAFFSGSGDRSNVPIQLQLGGMSLEVPPNTYSTTIVFTVVDI